MYLHSESSGEYYARKPGDSQQIIQQRNYLRNMNPRDTVNVNLRKAFLEYDKNLYVENAYHARHTGFSFLIGQDLLVKMTSKQCARIWRLRSMRVI